MSPAAEQVIERLDATRQKWWLFSLLSTASLAICVSLGALMLCLAADSLWRFSQPTLIALFSAWVALSALIFAGLIRRLLRGQRSIEAVARRLETEFPELGSRLINVVQLAEDERNVDRQFCEAAVRQSAAEIGPLAFDRAAYHHSRWRRLRECMQMPRDLIESLVVLSLLIAAAMLGPRWLPAWSSSASRILTPWQFTPSVGAVRIVKVTPGDADVLLGASVAIVAEIDNPDRLVHRGTLFVRPEGEPESPLPMTADESYRRYQAVVPSVLKPFRYWLEVGDSQTAAFSIRVREKPIVAGSEVVFHFPEYLQRKDEPAGSSGLDLEAPQFTVAELRLKTSSPIAKGFLEADGERVTGLVSDDGRRLSASLPMWKNGSYAVHLLDDGGRGDPSPRLNRITVQTDQPPTVELLKPAPHTTVAPSTTVQIAVRAGDDHGLGQVRVEMKVAASSETESDDAERPIAVVRQWNHFGDASTTSVVRRCEIRLTPKLIQPGQTLLVRAVARDRRSIHDGGLDLRPQETTSGWCAVKIVTDAAQATEAVNQMQSLHAVLQQMLEKQVAARVDAGREKAELAKRKNPSSADVSIRSRQIEIQKSAVALTESLAKAQGDELSAVRRALAALSTGEMLSAVAQCDALVQPQSPADRAATLESLIAGQDRVIATLRKLLGAMRHAQAEASSEMKKRPGGDLPNDARQKLAELRDRLDKFLKQQKKVIEASENLAKTPVEDFTKEQEALLQSLAAAEDDLAKFINELHSDFSKLPEQDFANPSTAKELVDIQTQLKMAEDALTKKSTDIAVPLEQLGYEMAEELKTNLEKWLPDSPDREKWSQEESPTDKDKEAPMAELPGELEDMVGELMEQEEDLFDEMEDVSSSAADSLDKGAGWDAVDGPISNMSGKGVTGNRLPNTSEIGGRAGEGRQAKSSGEFVGDEAVGKGGRRTPSRLAPDPFVQGDIKDRSGQSAGGATGGGKRSGQGGEGLEGPQPRGIDPRDAQRLAGRQAQLRNKTEAVNLQLQVKNFHHTDLKKTIEAMAQVERDLKAGRYQNAMRQRPVLLDGLKNVKQHLQGEFEVRQDTTTNLPSDVRKEILGGMKDPSPAGWEALNRRYFERLSGGKNEKP
ncbi:MAG: hypothetical protein ABFC77_00520 [Thermoguttaceae bacterium]